MAASFLRPSLSFPPSTGEGSQTPPAKRFAPVPGGSTAKTLTHSASSAGVDRKGDGEQFRHYDLALRVYSAVRNGRVVEGVNFPDAATKRKVYRLVFDVLYHWEVIEDLLIESGFYTRNCDLHGQESLIQLMAFDYQDKKFSLKLPRTGSENIPSLVVRVGEALCRHRVRLNAALARMRVKSNAQTTSQLMSEVSCLKYQAVVTEPFYVRVNARRVGKLQAEIVSPLSDDGLTLCSGKEELQKGGKLFCQMDQNLLAFSPHARETIFQHQLLTDGCLVQQDSASYFFIERMKDLLAQCSGYVIVTHCNAGVEVGHIASLMTGDAKVIVYGVLPVQMDSLTRNLHNQHIDNVEFVHAPFTHADASDEDLADVSAIICLPPSSLSTVIQPLDFIHQEGDHLAPLLLSEKASFTCSMSTEQTRTLAHALHFSQSQYIVYAVRSQEKCETSNVVSACLEQHRAKMKEGDRDFLHTPLPSVAAAIESDVTVAGYHVTLLERKPEDPKPTASEIIAKAVTSGVLSSEGLAIGECTSTPSTLHTKKKRKKKTQHIFSQHKGIPMTISARNKMVSKRLPTSDANSPRPFR